MENFIVPLSLFALSMCITPGPNNVMLTASGANFGFRRTIPHILGVGVGMLLMFVLSGFGLGILFENYPLLQQILKYCSISYLFYLSVRIAFAKRGGDKKETTQPLKVYQATLFQLINPKVLLMAITAMSTFSLSGGDYYKSVGTIIVVFSLVCMPAVSVWAGFGTVIGRVLKGERSLRIFNVSMGILTASSVFQMI